MKLTFDASIYCFSNAKVTKEQEVLELMNQEIFAKQQDLEALLIEIKKQRSLLELVNTQVEGDLESKHKEIQVRSNVTQPRFYFFLE